MHFPNKIFITGTDTEVGKTVVAAILTMGLKARYWKPVCSGIPNDTEFVQETTALPQKHFLKEVYALTQPLSPHLAARLDGLSVDLERINMPDPESADEAKHLIIEGAGGVLVPLNDRHLMIDMIARLGAPAIVVARSKLGTINHTLLTLGRLKDAGIDVLGVVMNGPRNEENKKAIEQYGKVKVLAQIEPLSQLNAEALQAAFDAHFQIYVSPANSSAQHQEMAHV